ncbi:MAG TPA: RNA methyltransferase [Actinomycetota bacterium]|nr:RNA methyltransferase [Actinomycetota bacterium]
MPPELISSPSNPLLKRIRKLRQRKHRAAEGALFVEGIAPVWAAIDAGAGVELLVVAPDLLTSDRAGELLSRVDAPVSQLTAGAFESIAERENPSGLGALVAIPSRALDDVVLDETALVVALDEVGNPGNLGTIVRTADAAAAAAVVVAGDAADAWHPGAVKASMGTVFSTPVVAAPLDEVLAWARKEALAVVATSAHGRVDHWFADYPDRCLLLFGSEATGLSQETLAAADEVVRIPQQGAASSLNLAVAAGIVIYEAVKRRARPDAAPQ